MTFKTWQRRAGNKEIGTSEDGNFQITRLPDGQHIIWFRKVPTQSGRAWIWVTDSTGKRREFETVDEAAEEAKRQRDELLKRYTSL